MAELKDEVCAHTKYGATSSELRALLNKRCDKFVRVGDAPVISETGSYRVDMWWLKTLLPKANKVRISVMEEALREKPKSMAELKDEVCAQTKYVTTSSDLRALLNKHCDKFVRVGDASVISETGSYRADMWWLKTLLPKANKIRIYTRWTPEMKMLFIKLRIIDKLTQENIAVRMKLRLTQIKGIQKDLKAGRLDEMVSAVKKERKGSQST